MQSKGFFFENLGKGLTRRLRITFKSEGPDSEEELPFSQGFTEDRLGARTTGSSCTSRECTRRRVQQSTEGKTRIRALDSKMTSTSDLSWKCFATFS